MPKKPLTDKERSQKARMAAYVMHSRNDSKATTAKARAAFMNRFEEIVDPERVLSEDERLRRAEMARKAHFQALAIKSAEARKARS